MIVKNVCLYLCDEGTGDELCVNCPLSFSVVIKFFVCFGWFVCLEVWFFLMFAVDISEDCVMNVDFNDNFKRVIHRGRGGRSSAYLDMCKLDKDYWWGRLPGAQQGVSLVC